MSCCVFGSGEKACENPIPRPGDRLQNSPKGQGDHLAGAPGALSRPRGGPQRRFRNRHPVYPGLGLPLRLPRHPPAAALVTSKGSKAPDGSSACLLARSRSLRTHLPGLGREPERSRPEPSNLESTRSASPPLPQPALLSPVRVCRPSGLETRRRRSLQDVRCRGVARLPRLRLLLQLGRAGTRIFGRPRPRITSHPGDLGLAQAESRSIRPRWHRPGADPGRPGRSLQ